MNGIERAIKATGGLTKLARQMDLTPPAISRWIGAGVPPIERCVSIERITGVSRRDLRPSDWGEIWPELIDAAHPWPPTATDPTQQQAA